MPDRPRSISFGPFGLGGRSPSQVRSKRFYASVAWLRMRDVVKAEQPLCADCPPDRPSPSDHIHHIVPYEQRPDLGLTRDNLVGLCEVCHMKRHKGVKPR